MSEELDTAIKHYEASLTAADQGDSHGYLSHGLSQGYTTLATSHQAKADLLEVIGRTRVTVQSLGQHDQNTSPLPAWANPAWQLYRRGEYEAASSPPLSLDDQILALLLQQQALNIEGATTQLTSAQQSIKAINALIQQNITRDYSLPWIDQSFYEYQLSTAMAPVHQQELAAWNTLHQHALLEISRLELEYQRARQQQLPAMIQQSIAQQLAAARIRVHGDPAQQQRLRELEQQRKELLSLLGIGQFEQGFSWLLLASPTGWSTKATLDYSVNATQQDYVAIEQEIAALRPLTLGLQGMVADTQAALLSTQQQCDTSYAVLSDNISSYHTTIDAVTPEELAALDRWQAELATAQEPAVQQIFADLRAALQTHDPQVLGSVLDRIEHDQDLNIRMMTLRMEILIRDPRLHYLDAQRMYTIESEKGDFARGSEALIGNILLLGLPAFLEHQSQLNAVGADDMTKLNAKVGLAGDALGLALMLAGPLGKLRGLVKGEGAALRFSDELATSLRDAGYSPAAISLLERNVYDAATNSAEIRQLFLSGSTKETSQFLQNIRYLDTISPEQFLKISAAFSKSLKRPITAEDLDEIITMLRAHEGVIPPPYQDAERIAGWVYFEQGLDQYPIAVQNAILNTMVDNSAIALRSRPAGAYQFESLYPPKDGFVTDKMIVYKFDDGRRVITRNGQLEIVLSDIDVADYIVDAHVFENDSIVLQRFWVEDDVFINPGGFMYEFAKQYGTPSVQHGVLTRGLTMDEVIHKLGNFDIASKTYKNPDRIVKFFNDETVYVFQKKPDMTGFVKEMELLDYLEHYNMEAYEAIRVSLPEEIGRKIFR